MIVQGLRSLRVITANTTFGLPGWSSTSDAPVLSLRYSTFFQFRPPSVVRKIPRSALFLKMFPVAETKTMSGLVGWIRTAPIWPASRSPTNVQVCPASFERYTPRPVETLLRRPSDPVPPYTTLGSLSATLIAPMDATSKWRSVIGTQLAPASVVFHTPPLATPM